MSQRRYAAMWVKAGGHIPGEAKLTTRGSLRKLCERGHLHDSTQSCIQAYNLGLNMDHQQAAHQCNVNKAEEKKVLWSYMKHTWSASTELSQTCDCES